MPLFDASSIQAATRRLRADAAQVLEGQTVLDLTLYELGNIVWKENRETGGDPGKAAEKAGAVTRLTSIMNIRRIEPGDLPAIAMNAAAYGLTFYDSAYLTAAQVASTTLVTEDAGLLRAAKDAGIMVTPLEQHLKTAS